jgi:hypothetical protein
MKLAQLRSHLTALKTLADKSGFRNLIEYIALLLRAEWERTFPRTDYPHK